jgi:3-deoxy-D-manno-octulosonate 8-phosphate phosphatase (KDO 8-P phosphatase)
MKAFNSQDGIALWMLPDLGIQSGIISGRESSGVSARAKLINIKYVVQNTKIKQPAFEQMCQEAGVTADQTAFMGDDMTDIPVLHRCGFAIAPANARPEAKKAAHYVTKASGGHGAVREAVEFILNAQGKWKDVVKRFS